MTQLADVTPSGFTRASEERSPVVDDGPGQDPEAGPEEQRPGRAPETAAMTTRIAWSQPTFTPGRRKVDWGRNGSIRRGAAP